MTDKQIVAKAQKLFTSLEAIRKEADKQWGALERKKQKLKAQIAALEEEQAECHTISGPLDPVLEALGDFIAGAAQ